MSVRVCYNMAETGSCSRPNCRFAHEIIPCELCRIWCVNQQSFSQHLGGRQHRENLRAQRDGQSSTNGSREGANGRDERTRCTTCDVMVSGPFETHVNGLRHRMRAAELGVNPSHTSAQSTIRCQVCARDVAESAWVEHMSSVLHSRKERFARYSRMLKESERDKCGVRILEKEVDFQVVEVDSLERRPTPSLKVNVLLDRRTWVILQEVRMTSSLGLQGAQRQMNFSSDFSDVVCLSMERPHKVEVIFDPRGNRGRYEDRIEFTFKDMDMAQKFIIARPVRAIVGVAADLEILRPTAPYTRPQPKQREREGRIIDGVRPPALAEIRWAVDLPESQVPDWISSALEEGNRAEKLRKVEKTILPRYLVPETYARHWNALLWVEELQMKADMQQYDLSDVGLENHRDYYYLKVPGLAEKRPSVIVGDSIKVRNHGSPSDHWFKGYVHVVRENEVGLRFHSSFNSYRGNRYDVRFELGRLPLRRMHQALETSFYPRRVLFPSSSDVRGYRPDDEDIDDLRLVNRLIGTNLPQLTAVASIISRPPGSIPFVVFGPPGTGKTITIIEAIRQLLLGDPKTRVLACAPSNSAADIIAERLADLGRSTIFRLNAPSRPKASLPPGLVNLSRFTDHSETAFAVPSLAELKKFRVVVSTCISASVPYGIGMTPGHFTHIFIDEAGQACEPEAMIPIKTISGPHTNIILSGDPKQLGPIVRSPISQKLGLGTSYLDRLMKLPVYSDSEYKGSTFVKLIKNWRSHPTILKYPNEEFYKNELEPYGNPVVINSLLNWDTLPKPGFPIIFHAIKGQDMREASSPSFFNRDEASLVKKYIEDLRSNTKLRLENKQIGVISPYNAQVQKIRSLLRMFPGIKVGSVEEFQGQERRVIIISTVRSSIDFVSFDLRHTLGFVSSPRRFNVAITRAQAALVVIGDPDVLGLDPLWREFLNYIHQNGGWKGVRIPWNPFEVVDRGSLRPVTSSGKRPDKLAYYSDRRREEAESEMDLLVDRVKAMVVGRIPVDDREDDDESVDSLEGNADRPWREDE